MIVDRNSLVTVKTAVCMLSTVKKLYPSEFRWRASIDGLAGTPKLRLSIQTDVPPDRIFDSWQQELEAFNKIRAKYSLH